MLVKQRYRLFNIRHSNHLGYLPRVEKHLPANHYRIFYALHATWNNPKYSLHCFLSIKRGATTGARNAFKSNLRHFPSISIQPSYINLQTSAVKIMNSDIGYGVEIVVCYNKIL